MKPNAGTTTGTMVPFRRPDGQELQGYLAKPEKPEARRLSSSFRNGGA